jgi:arylsulfatase
MFQGGTARLTVDGAVVAEGPIKRFTPVRFSITDAGLTCGRDAESAVTPRYAAPNAFTGTLQKVVVELEGESTRDPNVYAEARLRTQ